MSNFKAMPKGLAARRLANTDDREPFRGLMLDPGRLTERHAFYFDLLPDLARSGYNTLWWHFMDDEGFAQQLRSHPELATPYAFTIPETRRFVAAARAQGIDVVPEVETLGHTRCITGLPRYAHLFNGRPFGHNAMCPSHPDTLALLRDIIPEVAELFGGRYLHAGLDESDLHGCARCARRNHGHPPWHVLAAHILEVHAIVTGCGRRMIMWADPVEHHPELLQILPRDIILAHWHYGAIPVDKIVPSVRAGFEIVCVPAISGVMVQPDAAALRNHDGMVELSAQLSKKGSLGVVACWWEPFRSLRDAYRPAIAYAGASMRAGRALDKGDFFARFAREYFGSRTPKTGAALLELHAIMLSRGDLKTMLFDSLSDMASAYHLGLGPSADDPRPFAERRAQAAAVLDTLNACRPSVRRNRDAFGAHLLSARVVHAAYEQTAAVVDACRRHARAATAEEVRGDRSEIVRDLRACRDALAARRKPMRELARDLSAEWDRTRHPRDTKKDMTSPYMRQRILRALLTSVTRSADYLDQLVLSFNTAIGDYRRGGAFPGGLGRTLTS